MTIITLDKTPVEVQLVRDQERIKLLQEFAGRQDNALRKKWTARTFVLSDGRVLVEFFDKHAALLKQATDLKHLERVKFVKNNIWNLKKNISYKIELSNAEATQILHQDNPKKLSQFQSEMPEYFDFDVYELSSGQILFIDKTQNISGSAIYPDLKTLASENSTIAEQVYGSEDDEHLMKKLAAGDPMTDFDPNQHLIYPHYLDELIKNHQLQLIESKVYVEQFYGNLYRSERGYLVLIDEVNQTNGAGNKMPILTLRMYENLQQVRDAQSLYESYKNNGVHSEHFYAKISGTYGQRFADHVPQLIDSLPALLNIDREQLAFDTTGIDLIDEALKWHADDPALFDRWFPAVLAYFGQVYISTKNNGKWTTRFDKDGKVWIPQIVLKDGQFAWDDRVFYKDLMEGSMPLRWKLDHGEMIK